MKTKRAEAKALMPGVAYHIYNRGVNGETLFKAERNYAYFLNLYCRHIQPVAETLAFCLLPNHFHLLVRVKKPASQAFSNLFNAYARTINLAYRRTGPLFERPFRRLPVVVPAHFMRLMVYIHRNPQRHGLIDDFRRWPYSSYHPVTGFGPSFLTREVVVGWAGDMESLIRAHADEGDLPDFEEDM
jgi:putative transposase